MRRLYLNQGSDYSVYPLASIAGRPRIDKRKEFGVNNRTQRSEPNSYAIIFLPTPLVLSMCLFYFAFYDFPFISHHVFCAFVEYHLQSTNDLIVPSIYLFCRGYTSPKNWSDFPPVPSSTPAQRTKMVLMRLGKDLLNFGHSTAFFCRVVERRYVRGRKGTLCASRSF